MRRVITLIAVAVLAISAFPKPANAGYDKYTKVAIVPTVNATGGDVDFGAKLVARTNTELTKEFTDHGFTIVDDKIVTKVTKLDMTDEENQTRNNLYAIGQRAGADIVVFVVLTDASQQQHSNFFDATKEGIVKGKIWCLDVKGHQVIKPMSGSQFRASSKHHDWAGFGAGGSGYELAAAENIVRETLKDFFHSQAPVP